MEMERRKVSRAGPRSGTTGRRKIRNGAFEHSLLRKGRQDKRSDFFLLGRERSALK